MLPCIYINAQGYFILRVMQLMYQIMCVYFLNYI